MGCSWRTSLEAYLIWSVLGADVAGCASSDGSGRNLARLGDRKNPRQLLTCLAVGLS